MTEGALLIESDRLEEPCLAHVHGDPTKPHETNGHELTTTSQLLHVCQSSPPHTVASLSRIACESAPGAMLTRLLSLSPDLTSDGEVTPVQAWNHILCAPYFGGVNLRSIRELAEKLRDAVKCHG